MSAGRRRLAAIMFTDMVGYSALAQSDESTALGVLERHNALLRPIFAKFGGREVKTVGDAFLVEFGSALEAAQAALEIQSVLHVYNASAPAGWKIRIRIGIHVGDVVESGGDLLGDSVNIASRIEPLAEPEGIVVSQQVYDQIQNKLLAPLAALPPTALKNIQFPVKVYRVVQAWDSPRAQASPPSAPGLRHIAVLPLSNISPDPKDEYFADGLTEELITVLSQVQGLSVIARTSVIPYKTAPKPIAQLGAELGVDTVLEGSVRKAGQHIRIALQLIDVPTQAHIWANSYNREIDDVFAVQADIAERTAEALRLQFAKAGYPGAKRRPTANLAAYDLYLRGLAATKLEGLKAFDESKGRFEAATKLDPTFAEAFAAWANLYVMVAGDQVPMQEVMPPARQLAARALELDPNSSDAHAALANLSFQFDLDWKLAETEFQKAIALNPSNAMAHNFLGLMYFALGRFDEAKEVLRTAIRLDPAGPHRRMLAWVEFESGEFDAGITDLEEQLERDPTSINKHTTLGLFYLAAGRRSEALREADTPLTGASDEERFDHALLNVLLGRPEEAQKVTAELEKGEWKSYLSATYRAMLYAALGEKTKALDLLEEDFRHGDRVLWLWYRGIYFDSIRDNPRFASLIRQYGLPIPQLYRPGPATPQKSQDAASQWHR
jgi:adenylate cyclase